MAEDEPLIPGDIVRLKSGGPAMMVDRVIGGQRDVMCTWFDDGRRSRGRFPRSVLDKVAV